MDVNETRSAALCRNAMDDEDELVMLMDRRYRK
jgi:hypothetical protein